MHDSADLDHPNINGHIFLMPNLLTLYVAVLILAVASGVCGAGEATKLLFEDDFQRSESQEDREELGNGWGTNSKKRAGGNKQVDLRDGALFIASVHEAYDSKIPNTRSITEAANRVRREERASGAARCEAGVAS